MLNRRNKAQDKTLNKNTQTANAPAITYITDSTKIVADMNSEDDVRIAGTIEGKIKSRNKVMVSESGIIKGSITSSVADISGKIEGDLQIKESLILRASAKVDGEISTSKIKIEQGAQIKGNFQVGTAAGKSSKNSS